MSAELSALNLKRWGSNFGLGSIFGPKMGTTPTALAARWLGLAMSGPAGSGIENVKARSAVVEREPDASPAVISAPSTPEQLSALTAEGLSTADRDRLLVVASLSGDQAAFAELVSRYQSAVYNMAYRMLGDGHEAEDAAQEVFVRAWNQLRTFQTDRRFSTWLLSIASHYCIDLLRRRKPQAPLDGVALYVQSDDPEPDEVVLKKEQREMVRDLVATLPDKYRAVTLLRYYGDMSYDEIARATGLTESAVKTQLHRARRMLAERLAAQNTGPSPSGIETATQRGGGS
jgi:RNA polymerase sigma-70 factor (ECF subfamily)